MRLVLMCLAFAATVLLVLSLYPSVTNRLTGQDEAANRNTAGAEKAVKFSYPLVIFGVVFAVMVLFDIGILISLCAAIVAGALFFVAILRLTAMQKRRKELAFEDRMMDFLVLVSNNLKSGFALPNAIDVSSRSVGGVLGEEFNVMMGEYRLGMELGEAVGRMNQRISSENLQLFAATVSVTVRTGSSISEVLDRLITTIRKRNEVSDKLKALTAQFNFEALMMSFFPLIIFCILYLITPDLMLPMITTVFGWIAIGVLVLLELTGVFILKKMCDVKM